MKDLDLDGILMRVLQEHKHKIAELLSNVCSHHYEETLCLMRKGPPVSLPSTSKNNLRGLCNKPVSMNSLSGSKGKITDHIHG